MVLSMEKNTCFLHFAFEPANKMHKMSSSASARRARRKEEMRMRRFKSNNLVAKSLETDSKSGPCVTLYHHHHHHHIAGLDEKSH